MRACRLCGCTETNACVDEFGAACWWVPDHEGGDLCSACQPAAESAALTSQLMSGIPDSAWLRPEAIEAAMREDFPELADDMIAEFRRDIGVGVMRENGDFPFLDQGEFISYPKPEPPA